MWKSIVYSLFFLFFIITAPNVATAQSHRDQGPLLLGCNEDSQYYDVAQSCTVRIMNGGTPVTDARVEVRSFLSTEEGAFNESRATISLTPNSNGEIRFCSLSPSDWTPTNKSSVENFYIVEEVEVISPSNAKRTVQSNTSDVCSAIGETIQLDDAPTTYFSSCSTSGVCSVGDANSNPNLTFTSSESQEAANASCETGCGVWGRDPGGDPGSDVSCVDFTDKYKSIDEVTQLGEAGSIEEGIASFHPTEKACQANENGTKSGDLPETASQVCKATDTAVSCRRTSAENGELGVPIESGQDGKVQTVLYDAIACGDGKVRCADPDWTICRLEEGEEANLKCDTGIPLPPAPQCKTRSFDGQLCDEISSGIGGINTSPEGFVKALFGFLLSIAGGIALLLIIRSGYQMITSQGEPEKLKEARERLTSVVVGLLFLIFSLVILEIIGVDILRLPGLV